MFKNTVDTVYVIFVFEITSLKIFLDKKILFAMIHNMNWINKNSWWYKMGKPPAYSLCCHFCFRTLWLTCEKIAAQIKSLSNKTAPHRQKDYFQPCKCVFFFFFRKQHSWKQAFFTSKWGMSCGLLLCLAELKKNIKQHWNQTLQKSLDQWRCCVTEAKLKHSSV